MAGREALGASSVVLVTGKSPAHEGDGPVTDYYTAIGAPRPACDRQVHALTPPDAAFLAHAAPKALVAKLNASTVPRPCHFEPASGGWSPRCPQAGEKSKRVVHNTRPHLSTYWQSKGPVLL